MAAGHSIGTIFAELDLDASRYVRGQQKLLKDATSTTLNIEQNFKNLNIKSSAEMDLMRAKISNSYERIKNSAQATANDILRAEKAKNDQLTRINELQFGKQTSFLTQLKTHWLGVTAAIGSMAILRGVTMDIINTGVAAESLTTALKSATGSMEEARSAEAFLAAESERLGLLFEAQVKGYTMIAAASRGTILEGQKTRDIWQAVAEAGAALQMSGSEVEGAMRAISQMMSKGKVQAEELRGQLGERLPGAFQISARAMNMTTAELSKALELGNVYSDDFLPKFAQALHEQYGQAAVDASDTARAAINRYDNALRDVKITLSTVLIPAYTGFLELLSATGEASRTISGMHAGGYEVEELTKGSSSVRLPITGDLYPSRSNEILKDTIKSEKDLAKEQKERLKAEKRAARERDKWLDDYLDGVDDAWKAEVKWNEGIGDLAVETSKEKTKAYEDFYKDVDRLGKKGFIAQTSQNQKLLKNTDQMIDGQLEAVGGMYESEETLAQRAFDYQVSLLDQRAEYYYEHMQDTTQVDEWYNAAWEELAANRNSKDEQNLKDKADAYKEMYDILREHTTEYNEEIDELERQAAANRMLKLGELTGNYVLAMEAMAELDRIRIRDNALAYGNFFDGIMVGLDDLTEDMTSWAEVAHSVFGQFATDVQSTLSDGLFAALKGDFDEFELDWETMWDNMLHTMTDMVAEMAVEAGAALAKDVLGEIGGWAKSIFFHEGAWNVGQGLAGDEYPAILQQGEMVIPKKFAEELRAIWKAGTPITTPSITGAEYGAWAGATEPGLTPGSYGMVYSSTYGLIPAASYSAAVGAAEAGALGALSASEAAAGASTGVVSGTLFGNIAGPLAAIAMPIMAFLGGRSSSRKTKHAFEDWYNSLSPDMQQAYARYLQSQHVWDMATKQAGFTSVNPSDPFSLTAPILQSYAAPYWLTSDMVFAPRIPVDTLLALPNAIERFRDALYNKDSWVETGITYTRSGLWEDNYGDMYQKAMEMRYGENWQIDKWRRTSEGLNTGTQFSFATGTGPEGLPRTGWYYGHKKEIVLNNEQSESIRRGERQTTSRRPLHIHIGNREFVTFIDERSDHVRVKAERRKMATKRMYS